MTEGERPTGRGGLDKVAQILRDAPVVVPPKARKSARPKRPPKGSAEPARRGRPPARPRAADFDGLAWLDKNATAWADPRGEVYLSARFGGHFKNVAILSDLAKFLISEASYDATGKMLSPGDCEKPLRILQGRALTFGPKRTAALRTCWDGDDICIDLGGDDYRMVRVTKAGWHVEPIGREQPFIRKSPTMALPEPEIEGRLDAIRPFFNAERESDFILIWAWLVNALRPAGPYPFLAIGGEQGTAKSTLSKCLRRLTDPSAVPIRSQPTKPEDYTTALANAHVAIIDNASRFPGWLSDLCCTTATGGGHGARKLYSDNEESLFWGMRPQIANGIPNILNQPDLLQRAYAVRLRPIAEGERRTERNFWAAWEAIEGQAFGLILDGLSAALAGVDRISAENHNLPRLADAAIWMMAAEVAMGFEKGAFMSAMAENSAFSLAENFQSDPVAMAINALVPKIGDEWCGSPSDLLAAVSSIVSEATRKSYAWPATPQGLTAKLERVSPVLRSHGIHVRRTRGETRIVFITRHDPRATPEVSS